MNLVISTKCRLHLLIVQILEGSFQPSHNPSHSPQLLTQTPGLALHITLSSTSTCMAPMSDTIPSQQKHLVLQPLLHDFHAQRSAHRLLCSTNASPRDKDIHLGFCPPLVIFQFPKALNSAQADRNMFHYFKQG